jgi:PTS system cellobiose-specific IIA component
VISYTSSKDIAFPDDYPGNILVIIIKRGKRTMTHSEQIAFDMIGAAGDGRAKITEALEQARKNNFGKAESALKMATEYLLKAHQLQTQELLKKQADGTLQDPYNAIIAHAQDYVMTSMAMKDLAIEIVHLYAKVDAVK